jgi:hypothetical protein
MNNTQNQNQNPLEVNLTIVGVKGCDNSTSSYHNPIQISTIVCGNPKQTFTRLFTTPFVLMADFNRNNSQIYFKWVLDFFHLNFFNCLFTGLIFFFEI